MKDYFARKQRCDRTCAPQIYSHVESGRFWSDSRIGRSGTRHCAVLNTGTGSNIILIIDKQTVIQHHRRRTQIYFLVILLNAAICKLLLIVTDRTCAQCFVVLIDNTYKFADLFRHSDGLK